MRKHWKSEKGLTLVELLAAVVLAALAMAIVYGLLMTGNKQYKNQIEKNNQLTDISYVLKIITKDIRKSVGPKKIDTNEIDLDGINYLFDGNAIKRNGVIVASSIDNFHVEVNNNKWIIVISSSAKEGIGKTEKTEIILRTGDD